MIDRLLSYAPAISADEAQQGSLKDLREGPGSWDRWDEIRGFPVGFETVEGFIGVKNGVGGFLWGFIPLLSL